MDNNKQAFSISVFIYYHCPLTRRRAALSIYSFRFVCSLLYNGVRGAACSSVGEERLFVTCLLSES